MTVWIVTTGERHESYTIEGVYDSLEKAQTRVESIIPAFSGGWVKQEDNYWVNECDFISIFPYEVE